MYIEEKVSVEEILYEDEEVQLLKTSASAKKALLYISIIPKVKVGDEVIVNATSTRLNLGTGGMDIVTSVIGSSPKQNLRSSGHIMKARYLPNQHSVMSVESQESDYHHLFQGSYSLKDKKILIGELHSMIPICFWAMDYLSKDDNMIAIISDEASIPLSLSRHIRELKKEPRFSTITIGQAFGGKYEAINLPTALQFATDVLKGDVILVTLGPGVVGSGTYYGFSGIEQASWANIIGSLGGSPVWIPRLSEKDKRDRHLGISHHTSTPLNTFTHVNCTIPMPEVFGDIAIKITKQIEIISRQHSVHWLTTEPLKQIVQHCLEKSAVPIKTMGRGYEDDPIFFLGVVAAVKWLIDNN